MQQDSPVFVNIQNFTQNRAPVRGFEPRLSA